MRILVMSLLSLVLCICAQFAVLFVVLIHMLPAHLSVIEWVPVMGGSVLMGVLVGIYVVPWLAKRLLEVRAK